MAHYIDNEEFENEMEGESMLLDEEMDEDYEPSEQGFSL